MANRLISILCLKCYTQKSSEICQHAKKWSSIKVVRVFLFQFFGACGTLTSNEKASSWRETAIARSIKYLTTCVMYWSPINNTLKTVYRALICPRGNLNIFDPTLLTSLNRVNPQYPGNSVGCFHLAALVMMLIS